MLEGVIINNQNKTALKSAFFIREKSKRIQGKLNKKSSKGKMQIYENKLKPINNKETWNTDRYMK